MVKLLISPRAVSACSLRSRVTPTRPDETIVSAVGANAAPAVAMGASSVRVRADATRMIAVLVRRYAARSCRGATTTLLTRGVATTGGAMGAGSGDGAGTRAHAAAASTNPIRADTTRVLERCCARKCVCMLDTKETMGGRRPVSRVLSVHCDTLQHTGRSFLSTCSHPHVPAAYPRLDVLPHRCRDGPSLAAYSALLRLGFTVPCVLPHTRWALTPPFHPYRCLRTGGLFSVALSVTPRSRPSCPGVTWQPALWSPDFPRRHTERTPLPTRPSGRRPPIVWWEVYADTSGKCQCGNGLAHEKH